MLMLEALCHAEEHKTDVILFDLVCLETCDAHLMSNTTSINVTSIDELNTTAP